MGIKFKFIPSKKHKGVYFKPNLTIVDLSEFRNSTLLKRQVVSLCNEIYDPLGLAVPYAMKLKLLIRETLLHKRIYSFTRVDFTFHILYGNMVLVYSINPNEKNT